MNTPDIATAFYVAIANGLLTDTAWPVKAENFVSYDGLEGLQTPDKQQTADSDYPQAELVGPIEGSINLTGNDVTFGTHTPEGCPGHVEPGNYRFRLTVTSQLLGIREVNPLTLESINAIRRLGPKLGGIDGVTEVKVRFREKQDAPDGDDLRRFITEIEIMISTEIDGSTLTG